MSNDFYKKLINDIDSLINEKNYQQAYKLVQEELAMPYVPPDTLEKLEYFENELKSYLEIEKTVKTIQPEDLVKALKKDNQNAYSALYSLSKSNIRDYLNEIQEVFDDRAIKRVMKSIVLEQLVNQQINKVYRFENVEVNPFNIKPVLELDYVVKTYSLLTSYVDDNPTFLQQCQFVLINSAYESYPNSYDDLDANYICFKIIKYVYQAYQQLDQWEKFVVKYNVDDCKLDNIEFKCIS